MDSYRPPQREVALRILTRRAWLDGTLRLPVSAHLLDYLRHAPRFLTLTGVQAEGSEREIPYFSLQRDAMAVVIPPEGEAGESLPETSPVVSHRVYCLLEQGSIRGTLRVLEHVRVSDYFMNRESFVMLHECVARLPDATGVTVEQRVPAAVVHSRHILGVSEPRLA